MMPCGPLADDWLFWDPETICAYPHSDDPETREPACKEREPEQLELFEARHGQP